LQGVHEGTKLFPLCIPGSERGTVAAGIPISPVRACPQFISLPSTGSYLQNINHLEKAIKTGDKGFNTMLLFYI
jgi:hypothetical protein